jgi:undecaprenyl phosphate N,N'-diacetylbacillosamine 1-phosphate transferase
MLYRHFFKRFFDIVIASVGLIVLSPLFLILWIWLSIANKGAGAFFLQERPGKDEKIFKVIKFKTMNDRRDENGNLLPDSERLTTIGRWIRSLSLDEIPQLINVLKGDMSLIGPRPLLVQYLPLYDEVQRRRHEVRPGITGWAQVNGRNAISWQEKFEHDVWYVDHLSLSLDIKILLKTIEKVFKREGINSETNATMEPFKGNPTASQNELSSINHDK